MQYEKHADLLKNFYESFHYTCWDNALRDYFKFHQVLLAQISFFDWYDILVLLHLEEVKESEYISIAEEKLRIKGNSFMWLYVVLESKNISTSFHTFAKKEFINSLNDILDCYKIVTVLQEYPIIYYGDTDLVDKEIEMNSEKRNYIFNLLNKVEKFRIHQC